MLSRCSHILISLSLLTKFLHIGCVSDQRFESTSSGDTRQSEQRGVLSMINESTSLPVSAMIQEGTNFGCRVEYFNDFLLHLHIFSISSYQWSIVGNYRHICQLEFNTIIFSQRSKRPALYVTFNITMLLQFLPISNRVLAPTYLLALFTVHPAHFSSVLSRL